MTDHKVAPNRKMIPFYRCKFKLYRGGHVSIFICWSGCGTLIRKMDRSSREIGQTLIERKVSGPRPKLKTVYFQLRVL